MNSVVVALVCIGWCAPLLAGTGPVAAHDEQDNLRSQVVARARLVAGLAEDVKTSANRCDSVAVIDFADTLTPFLGAKYASPQRVWRVSITDLRIKDRQGGTHSLYGNVELFIDSGSGELLKAVWNRAALDPAVDIEISAAVAEAAMLYHGESYSGRPTVEPEVSFMEAVLVCPHSPHLARQVIGQYVQWTDGGPAARRVWAISLRGIPPVQPHGPHDGSWMPDYMRNRMRCIVTLPSGDCIRSSNVPAPEMKPEDRLRLFGK